MKVITIMNLCYIPEQKILFGPEGKEVFKKNFEDIWKLCECESIRHIIKLAPTKRYINLTYDISDFAPFYFQSQNV